ncbi:hypothetical protein G6F68_010970 [Rhizopus microsporus]|nr:hypothetical protein G6F68_010970 [Rhizopus microsporus]
MVHQVVDALQALDVHGQPVQEDAGQRMAAHLRQRRIRRRIRAVLGVGVVAEPRADHQHAMGAQVDGRADRGQLAHRSVAAPFTLAMHLHLAGRKDKGDGRRGHQVVDADRRGDGQSQIAVPRFDGGVRLVEGQMLAAGVARGRDRQRR